MAKLFQILTKLYQTTKEAIHDLLIEEGYAPPKTSNTRDNPVPGEVPVFSGSTNNITDIWQFCLNIVISIFCWPLYLSDPDCIVWQLGGKDRVPAWVRQIIAYGLTSLWFPIIARILYLVVLQILDSRGQKIDEKDSFSDRKTNLTLDQISSDLAKIKKTLINNQIRGGAILTYSEPLVFEFLHPAFIFIHILRMTKLLKLKIGEEGFEKTVNNPNPKVVKPKRRPIVRPFLVCLLVAMRSRMSVNYVNISQESRQQICCIAPIERLSCIDFEKTYAIKNESAIKIQPGNNSFGFQPNKKLMTLGEFEFRRGVDKEGNVPILKRRNLSRIHQLKRNRVGTIEKLRKESQSLETISSDEVKPTEVSSKIPVSNKQL